MYGFTVLIYVFVGLLFIAISGPLIRGRIGRNALYGFRTPKTLSDDSIWYPANKYAGYQLREAGIVIVVAAIVFDLIPGLTHFGYLLGCTGTMLGSLTKVTISSFRYLRKL